MTALIWLCFASSIIAAFRSKKAVRDYNRSVWPSMHVLAPLYLRAMLGWFALALAIAVAAHFVPQP